MPAINVARTDTFEQQRVKINEIGAQIFNISAGGSDLSTGNLRLGDGSIPNPSLAFTNDQTLGIYRPTSGTIGFVYDSKKIFDVEPQNFVFYKDFTVRQQVLTTGGISVINSGENYDPGDYVNVPLSGGTGNNATADVTVEQFVGAITQDGLDYINGSFSGIQLSGGSPTVAATATFTIDGISGTIVGGNGYIPATYPNVSLTNVSGTGTGAIADVAIQGGVGFAGTISGGSGYTDGSYEQVAVYNQAVQTFVVAAITNPNAGQPGEPGEVYTIDGNTQPSLTLIPGNTYKFDTSDSSLASHPFRFETQFGGGLNPADAPGVSASAVGNLATAGSYYYVVIKDTTSTSVVLNYDCEVHNGMGGSITLQAGAAGDFGTGATANATISGGAVTAYQISGGSDYAVGDTVYSESTDMGGIGGSGFTFVLSGNVYTGVVASVNFLDIGSGYQNGDVLSANTSDLGGLGGGFTLTIETDPGKLDEITFDDKGSGYSAGDILTLPIGQTGVATTLPGQVLNVPTTLNTASTSITVASTTGIIAGMDVFNGQSDTGFLAPSTTVASVPNSTTVILSANPTVSGAAELSFASQSLNEITVASVAGVGIGDAIEQTGGSGILAPGTTVSAVDETTNTITLSSTPTQAGSATISILPPFGVGTTPFQYTINKIGGIESVNINSGGNGYLPGDSLTIVNTNLVQPITYTVTRNQVTEITLSGTVSASLFSVGDQLAESGVAQGTTADIIEIKSSGGNVTSLICGPTGFVSGTVVENSSNPGPTYTINTVVDLETKIFIDTGSGATLTPDLTLYVGNTYLFDYSDPSNDTHAFAFTEYAGGAWGASRITGITTTLDVASNLITVASTTGILAGMTVETSGQGSVGSLIEGTLVEEVVDATTIRLSVAPSLSGDATLEFKGVEYTQSVVVGTNELTIKITDTTPTLYYYDKNSADQGGETGSEAVVTIDPNNPKTFGSGLVISVLDTDQDDVITGDIETGNFFAKKIDVETSITSSESEATTSLTTPLLIGNAAQLTSISSSTNVNVNAVDTNINSNLNVGSGFNIVRSNGNVTTTGFLKTTSYLNVDDKITIDENEIASGVGFDLELTAAAAKLVKVTGDQALVIPVGNTSARPLYPTAQNGAIRYNTETNQYEGFSVLSGQSSGTWSSLGGVRDIDGNTYILAELTPGANDNNLWFYNDGINSTRLNRNYLEFVGTKKIRSLNTSAPAYREWTAQTSVSVGDYLKYKHDIYEVVVAGATDTSGNEPNNTTGDPFVNGTATLQYFTTAVSQLIFEEISEILIGPTKSTAMLFEGDLRITKNTISTDLTDLNLKPNTGRRIVCDSKTHLQIPSGTESEKSSGTAKNGSIRYNTTNQVYEGFSETTNTWGSLGGVKDVDQNTFIIPETAPGANENILYFYNDNVNTLQLTTTTLDFTNINTVSCSFDNSLEITAETVTFNNASTTIDNARSSDTTFIHTTRDKLDLGLSTGLVVDPLLRLDDQGDVYYNTGFGTGSESLVRIFDKELANLEISKYRITTSNAPLLKGTTNNGSAVIYAPATELSAKVELVAHNTTTGAKEVIEFSVIDNGSDIFYTEVGTIQSNGSIIDYTFDFNVNNAVRLNYSLATGVANANAVNVTVVSNVIKK